MALSREQSVSGPPARRRSLQQLVQSGKDSRAVPRYRGIAVRRLDRPPPVHIERIPPPSQMTASTPSVPSIQQRVLQRRKKADLSLRTKLGAVVAVAVLVLVLGALGMFLISEYRGSTRLVTHSREVQQTLAHALQRLTDAETGQRGLLLTGNEQFLEPYRGAATDVDVALDSLADLLKESPDQLLRLAELKVALHDRAGSLASLIKDHRDGAPVTSAELDMGKAQMNRVRSLMATMTSAEAVVLQHSEALTRRQGNIVTAVILPGSILAFALLLLINGAIRRDVAQRDAAHAQIEEQNTELEAQTAILADQQIELEQQLEESQVMTEELEATNEELQRITVIAEEEREAAEQARDRYRVSDSRFRFMADAIPVQVWTAASDGQLDFVSEGVAQYFGRSREEIIGEGWLSVIHPDDISPVVERWTHALATGEPYEVNFRLRRADGAYRWHIGRASAQRADGRAIGGWFGSNTDIDDQHRHLEQRETLVRNLERTNQELDQFAYVASHDLKAPLRGIANLSEWIEEDMGESFPAHAREKMDLLRGRVRRLEGLIDGILEYSRAGRTKKPPTPVDTAVLVQEVVDMLAPPAGTVVSIASDMPTVFSERVPLQQVFSNLVSNAIKYAGRSDIRVQVDAVAQGQFVQFRVTDNGPGIPPQFRERIFVVFQRLAARDKIEGTGIGLAIVKKIVEGRGGRVWVESPSDLASGAGTTFNFTWPSVPRRES